MNIKLNNLSEPDNIVCLTGCPTILTIEDTWTGTLERATISIRNINEMSPSGTYYIRIGDVRLDATTDYTKAVGSTWWYTNSNTSANKLKMALSIAQAINNVPSIAVNFTAHVGLDSDGNPTASVEITARDYGVHIGGISIPFSSNIMMATVTRGSLTSTFNGETINKVFVDVYTDGTENVGTLGQADVTFGKFRFTLEKNVYGPRTSFDLSKVMAPFTDYNKISQFQLFIYANIDGNILNLRHYNKVFATRGYMINQGNTYIPSFTGYYLAQNVGRGATSGYLNNSILYVYEPLIAFSIYTTNTGKGATANVSYKNGANQEIFKANVAIFPAYSLYTAYINLNAAMFNKSSYIDVTINGMGTVRYNVIKPIHATDTHQRIYWTNSYGGVSFFDFTGARTEERKTDVETYYAGLYDFYYSDRRYLNRVYSKDVSVTVTMTTHNIAKDGTWQLFDLQNSLNAWTEINGVEYAIRVTDISVTESDVEGIYTANIEYEYSMPDTL